MSVSDQIIAVINDLGSKMGMAIDWTSANVIPYLQDLVMRISYMAVAKHSIGAALGIIALITSIVIWVKLSKFHIRQQEKYRKQEYVDEDDLVYIFGIIGIIIGFMLGIILLSVNVASLVEAIYLPEVAAYNYIQGLIPQGGYNGL
jgi:hypothetical protein